MSALKKVVNLLWYRTPKDHKLANELAEEFSKLEARIAELEAMTQWQPIETCPVETEIIVGNCFSKVVFQCEIMENRINAKWYTHWMPSPKPPEEK